METITIAALCPYAFLVPAHQYTKEFLKESWSIVMVVLFIQVWFYLLFRIRNYGLARKYVELLFDRPMLSFGWNLSCFDLTCATEHLHC